MNSLTIQDQRFGQKTLKTVRSSIWDGFIGYLRSGNASQDLLSLLSANRLILPKFRVLNVQGSLVALPTTGGIVLYAPGKGDFYYREPEEQKTADGFKQSGNGYGIFEGKGADGIDNYSAITWREIMEPLKCVVRAVLADFDVFEQMEAGSKEMAKLDSGFFIAESPFLGQMGKFALAASRLSGDFSLCTAQLFDYAFSDLKVVHLLSRSTKCRYSDARIQEQIGKYPTMFFTVLAQKNGDIGGVGKISTPLGFSFEVRGRCGFRLPGERFKRVMGVDMDSIFASSFESSMSLGNVEKPSSESSTSSIPSLPLPPKSINVAIETQDNEEEDEEILNRSLQSSV